MIGGAVFCVGVWSYVSNAPLSVSLWLTFDSIRGVPSGVYGIWSDVHPLLLSAGADSDWHYLESVPCWEGHAQRVERI